MPHAIDLLKGNTGNIKSTHETVQSVGHVCSHKSHSNAANFSKTKIDSTDVAGRARKSPFPMISVDEAQKIILSQCSTLGTERKRFSDALGFILAEHVYANDPLPPFAASIKDG